jgi:hypothetical protein
MSEIWSKMSIGLHVKYPLFLSDFKGCYIFSIGFRKIPIKFHENPPSGSRSVPCGQTDGRTDRYDEANGSFSQFFERA